MVAGVETRPLAGNKLLEEESLSEMDAIARGVEIRLGLPDCAGVTLATVEVARQLRIPKWKIHHWIAVRSGLGSGTGQLKSGLPSPASFKDYSLPSLYIGVESAKKGGEK